MGGLVKICCNKLEVKLWVFMTHENAWFHFGYGGERL
jgi:hypothetical protein